MATLRELIIKISANSTSFQSEIARASRMGSDYYKTMEQGGRKASAATRETQRALADLNSQLSSVRERAAGMAGAFAGAFATSQLVHYADTWNQLSGRLRLASTSAEDFTRSQQTLMSISQRTGTSFEANANLYSRIASSLRDAGYASADVAKVTETVATSLKLSGASTEEASSVITQLSQALGSGVLRGEEFNAIMESGGRLAKFLADGLGTTIGGLRNMANNGELTTDKIVPLLTNVDQLRKEFDTLPASISGSAQKVENAFMAWVGGANNAVGASSSLSGVLDGLAKNIDTVANAAGVLVGLGVARYFGNMVTGVASATASVISNTAAEVALAEAQLRGTQVSVATARQAVYRAQQARSAAAGIEAQIAAERQLAVAQAQLNTSITARSSAAGRLTETASVMSRLGSGVLGLLGGWPGVIIAAGTAMYGVYQHTQQVHQEAVAFSDNLDAINSKLNQMSVAGLRSTSADARGSLTAQKKDLADIDEQIRQTRDSLAAMQSMEKQYDEHPWLARINNLMSVEELTKRQQDATDQLNKLEYQREQAASKVEATQKLVNDASDLATKKAIEQAGAVAILKGAYDLLNRSMSAMGGATPPQYAGPVVSLAKATPQQSTALEKARRDNELASLSGLQKLHRQYEYEADDLKLTGALYTQYVYNKDQAAKKDAEAAQAKKDGTAATNAQNKAEREAASVAEQYARKMADLSVAVEVQKVRATEGEKASELYAASHQAGTKWTDEQRQAIRASSTELEKWTQKADENVRKQREQIEALKDLRDAARKYQDDAAMISSTAGMGDRQRERFTEQQQVDRVFDKTDKGADAVAARTAALDALDRKYQETAATEANWLNGVSRGYENWLANTSNVAGTVSQGITSTMDSALDNMSAMLVGSKADWKSWGLSVLQMISKVALQMAIVNAMGSSGSSFGSILGSVFSSFGGAAAGAAGGTTGAMGMSTSYAAYDDGGYTGPGGKHDPAGIVHKGEFVFTKEATQRIGVSNLYDMMRGYATGGYVGNPAQPIYSSGVNRATGSGNTVIQVNAPVSIVQDGGSGDASSAGTANAANQLKSIVQTTITERLRKEMSPGGVLYRA
ncbi:phage tail tape measure protein [Pantoea latae]|uniref:Phage tail tape measure protein n=1 Tax=Pantoea latae TaxID=1964541 RepID=A0A1V9DF61_9GAMM|nr:phage tail tape measure protein [Pantoea latae]OQP32438.1 phage tail tape measure protein [Pantoea latae]